MQGCVYILASRRRGTLYTGVTSTLARRIEEHKSKRHEGFTKKYNVTLFVYYELYDSITYAIKREKQIKHWTRAKKIELIEARNPLWKELPCW